MSRVALLRQQLVDARDYSLRLLAATPHEFWHRDAGQAITCVAWQAGHLAFAEYGLAVERVRGIRDDDDRLLPPEFRGWFGKGSRPRFEVDAYPLADQLLQVLQQVHTAALAGIDSMHESDLDRGVSRPHPLFTTIGGSLAWCVRHEMLHAGQIGLLRRELGLPPLW